MASFANSDDTQVNPTIDEDPAGEETPSPAANVPTVGEETPSPAAETPSPVAETPPAASTTAVETAGAEVAANAVVGKTCVEPMNAAPTMEDAGKYVMFSNDTYKVFTMPADAAMLNDAAAGAKFFKVLPDETKGGKHKKQHKSAKKQHKSAKKQRKLAKKQHKSAKKQRKSRSSRRSKK